MNRSRFRSSAQRHDDAAVAGQAVTVSVWGGDYRNQDLYEEQQVVTDADGAALATFAGLPQGWYRIVASSTDERGRKVEQTRYLWVFDRTGGSWWYSSEDEIAISTDKDSYQPGDVAQLLIESQVTGVALLTVERSGVLQEQIVNLDGPVTMVELAITEAFQPNVFAKLHIFSTAVDDDPHRNVVEGKLLTASVELTVPAESQRLTIDITPDAEEYLPGTDAELDIQVTDADGAPVTAQVSLALVDEAIFALAADNNRDIFDAFYSPQSNLVSTFDSLAPRRSGWSRFNDVEYPPPGGPGGTATPAPAPTAQPGPGAGAEETTEPRQRIQRHRLLESRHPHRCQRPGDPHHPPARQPDHLADHRPRGHARHQGGGGDRQRARHPGHHRPPGAAPLHRHRRPIRVRTVAQNFSGQDVDRERHTRPRPA